MSDAIWVWRHPRPTDVDGRCIGRTDVRVDPRKVRRLAQRIHRQMLANPAGDGARHVVTSPLQRCASVGKELRKLGWRHDVDDALLEMDFGAWEGQRWRDIDPAEIAAWTRDFLCYRPGGGESLQQVFDRIRRWHAAPDTVVVGHAGWMISRTWLGRDNRKTPLASEWPSPPRYGECWRLAVSVT